MIPSVRRAKDPTHRWGVWRRHASAQVSAIMSWTFSVAGSAILCCATTFVRARRLAFARPGFGELRRAVLVIATSAYLRVHAGRDCCVPVLSGRKCKRERGATSCVRTRRTLCLCSRGLREHSPLCRYHAANCTEFGRHIDDCLNVPDFLHFGVEVSPGISRYCASHPSAKFYPCF